MSLLATLSLLCPAHALEAQRPVGVDPDSSTYVTLSETPFHYDDDLWFEDVPQADGVSLYSDLAAETRGGARVPLRHANGLTQALHRTRKVVISACDAFSGVRVEDWYARVVVDGQAGPRFSMRDVDRDFDPGCGDVVWRAPFEGDFEIEVAVDGVVQRTRVEVRDAWMVSLGDSYSSGEGAPDVIDLVTGLTGLEGHSSMINHRSRYGWPHQVAETLQARLLVEDADWQLVFSYLPVSGDQMLRGIWESTSKGGGPEGVKRYLRSQIEHLDLVREAWVGTSGDPERAWLPHGTPTPDLLVMTGGGNDVRFAELVKDCYAFGCSDEVYEDFPTGAFFDATVEAGPFIASLYQGMIDDLHALELVPPPNRHGMPGAFVIAYPNPFHVPDGGQGLAVDGTCIGGMTAQDTWFAIEHVLGGMMDGTQDGAAYGDWQWVDTVGALASHGACAPDPWIHGVELEGLWVQHDLDGLPSLTAFFHPNREGHEAIAERAWDDIEGHLLVHDGPDGQALGGRVPRFDVTATYVGEPADVGAGRQAFLGAGTVTLEIAPGVQVRRVVYNGLPLDVDHAFDHVSPSVLVVELPDTGPQDEPLAAVEDMLRVERGWAPRQGTPEVRHQVALDGQLHDVSAAYLPLPDAVFTFDRVSRDGDGDGVDLDKDLCPGVADPGQEDTDGDLVGDACDNCPFTWNPDQLNTDGDDWHLLEQSGGDVCDADDDNDGIADDKDLCPLEFTPVPADEQIDGDHDGVGYECDPDESGLDLDALYERWEVLREAAEAQRLGMPILPEWGCLVCDPDKAQLARIADLRGEADAFVSEVEPRGFLGKDAKRGLVIVQEGVDAWLIEGSKLTPDDLAKFYAIAGL